MRAIRIQETVSGRLDDIYRYTRYNWGTERADRDITGLFEAFSRMDTPALVSRPVPDTLGVKGLFFHDQQHVVYWRKLSNGDIGIVTLRRKRIHQIERLREDFGL